MDPSYIGTFTKERQRSAHDIVTDIDSPRNGLFLNTGLHQILGSDFAILVTPNFAMDTSDIMQTEEVYGERKRRFTAHLFNFLRYPDPRIVGQAVRSPDNSPIWPADVLFDAVYASVVVMNFNALSANMLKPWMEKFYPNGPHDRNSCR